MNNIKNIIFDMGGVLVDLDPQRCIDAFGKIGCRQIAAYVEEHRTEDLFYDIETGRTTQQQFCQEVRRIAQTDAADAEIVWAWNQLLAGIADEKKARLIELGRTYRLYLLSNTNIMHWEKCRDDFFAYMGHTADDYFTQIFLSYEMHMSKPNADIFGQTLHDAGINAAETLFVDDSADNCSAARQLGINTLHETTGRDWMQLLQPSARTTDLQL